MRSRGSLTALAALLVVVSGCRIPRFEGPQIQRPPAGFTLRAASDPTPTTFPEHEVTFHSTWVHTDMSGVSLISVHEHPVVFDVDDVVAAQERVRATATDPDAVFDDIEAIRIDGRDAWGWYERIESPRRGLVQVAYRAVVPYDSVSYAIEFSSGEPSLKRAAPDTLRAVISTFGIGRTTYNIPLIVIVFGTFLLFVSILRARSRERADRLRGINLVTIEKQEEPEAGEASEGVEEGADERAAEASRPDEPEAEAEPTAEPPAS